MKENKKLKILIFVLAIVAFISIVILMSNITSTRKSLSKVMNKGNEGSLYIHRGNWDNSYFNSGDINDTENLNNSCPYDGNRENCENWNASCPYNGNRENCENWNASCPYDGNRNNCRNSNNSYIHHGNNNGQYSHNRCNNYNF